MNEKSVPLITSLTILASGFIATQAQASPIVYNPRPATCKLIENDELQEKCNSFKLTPFRVSEEDSTTLLSAEFSFENSRISYFVASEPAKTIENNGKTFNVHAMAIRTIKQPNLEPETSVADGLCLIASDYSQVVCQISGSSYLYTGNPVRVQDTTTATSPNTTTAPQNTTATSQNTATAPQNTTANSKQYVFNTNSHINTGISINPGDKIRVAVSGTVRFGFFVGSGGPEGIIISPDYNYFFDIPHGQVIGRLRQFGARELDGWLPIGGGRDFVASSQGVLEFAVNDNKPGDNSGAFRIEVTIEPAN